MANERIIFIVEADGADSGTVVEGIQALLKTRECNEILAVKVEGTFENGKPYELDVTYIKDFASIKE